MHSVVTVTLDPSQEFRFELDGVEPMAHEDARRWLDNEFIRMECEPCSASGKGTDGRQGADRGRRSRSNHAGRSGMAGRFARATSAALARPVVRVDVQSMTINY